MIAGQGPSGLEILEQNPYIESIVVPVGGGGLLAGIAAAVKQVNPKVKVYGVQTEQAPAMYLSKKENKWVTHGVGKTIADGIAVGIPGKLTWKLINQYVDDMLLVNEEEYLRRHAADAGTGQDGGGRGRGCSSGRPAPPHRAGQ